jgi:hypothetical protein
MPDRPSRPTRRKIMTMPIGGGSNRCGECQALLPNHREDCPVRKDKAKT